MPKHTLKEMFSDNREFHRAAVEENLESKGIEQRLSAPYSPAPNGGSERQNGTIVE